ncbi:MAG: HIT family protein [Nanoarchaeota archaeon]
MSDCVFCKIAAKEIPSEMIYEDRDVFVFLDLNPVNYGHILIIPKKHFKTMLETPEDILGKVFSTSKKFMKTIQKALDADFVALTVVGTDVPHFHVHVIPRYFNDGLAGFWPTKKYEPGQMKKFGDKIRKGVKK